MDTLTVADHRPAERQAVGVLTRTLLVDGHVHLHRPVEPGGLLDAAEANLGRARVRRGLDADVPGCLLFVDGAREDAFQHLRTRLAAGSGWRIRRTREDESLYATRGRTTCLLLIAGCQVRTAEGLEVLGIGTRTRVPDGESLATTLDALRAADAVPVVPWGFGKWWGRRGRLVRRLAEAGEPGSLCLGDNAGRPRRAPVPEPFRRALERGLMVLPGTDPLPLAGRYTRTGSFGFVVDGEIARATPARSFRALLRRVGHQPATFGSRSGTGAALLDQLVLRFMRRGEP